jgi:hypothetical protein
MTTSLNRFRQTLLEGALALLWRQWTLLGIPSHEGPKSEIEYRIIDPESLLLLTTELGRFDARLLDEATNWLRQYGRLINIQRLKGIYRQHELGDGRVLSAIACTVLQNSRLAKWRAIESLAEPRVGKEPLFRNLNGAPSPVFGKADPSFEKFGFFRGVQKPRNDASDPQVKNPDLLLVKLRALFGVNARAEIIAALLSTQFTHPSALARRTGYLPRSVQETLNEMALSGHLVTERPKGSREKFFSLRPGDWNFLITWPGQKFPQWIAWAIIFALIQNALRVLYNEKQGSLMATALRFREIFDRHYPALAEAGVAGHFSDTSHESGLKFLEAFLTEITNL